MQTRNWLKATLIIGGLCLAGMASFAQEQGSSQQTGDPVADAARKAREEKKNAQKPKKVFTDDDVRPAAPEKPAASNATAPGATSGTEKDDPNGEKAWRKRFSELRGKIANAEKELDILQREVQKAQVQYYTDPQKAMNEQNNRAEINDKNAKIADKKKELEQLHQQLDDLETELRKSGGDPGWAQ